MRQLATIQKISNLQPIKDADKIELATVLGWQVVVVKGEHKIGDSVVYVEIDSILPEKPEFEFLRSKKFRIKTIRLKGQVSQGICFPLSVIPGHKKGKAYELGADVSDAIGIKKYDPEAVQEAKDMALLEGVGKNRMDKFMRRYPWYRRFIFKPTKKPFPAFIKKTDEERIQKMTSLLETEKNTQFEVTEKVDGQSATYFLKRNPKRGFFQPKWLFGVASRNFQLLASDNSSYWTIAKQHDLKTKMTQYCDIHDCDLTIQGEIIGTKIQGNKYKVSEFQFYVFNVFTKSKVFSEQLDRHALSYFTRSMGLEEVPFLEYMYLPATVQELVEYSKGKSKINIHSTREGVVIRNYDREISFKVINPNFLLEHEL